VTYEAARRYIEAAAQSGITLGLDSIKHLLSELNNPQDDLKFIHLAGTNGKGSVLAYISTIMELAGYKTGRYISPTVTSYRERIQVNRAHISKEDFACQLSKIKKAIDKMLAKGLPQPSVFEIETALAFLHFKQAGCAIVVMETGMGGRTDATNIIKNTLVSVFTSVSRDHMEFLGDTIADLTQAKAGIIKQGSHVVYGRLPDEAEKIIKTTAKQYDNQIRVASLDHMMIQKNKAKYTQTFSYKALDEITIHLLGKHQIENATLAIEAVWSLQAHGFVLSDEQIKAGLNKTRWFARLTVVKEKDPVIIVDGAHNQDSVRALAETVAELFPTEKMVGIMGVFKDKEVKEMLTELKPVISKIHAITLPDEQRSLSGELLKIKALEMGMDAESHELLSDAMYAATTGAEVVVVFGSLSYLGAILSHI